MSTLFDRADELSIRVPTSCGRNGTCHECVVEIIAGSEGLEARTAAETYLRDPFRLACQAVIADEAVPVRFAPLQRRPKILATSYTGTTEIDPARGGLGLAVDLGTTTIVMEILDLATGVVVYATALENPQRFGGSDVINRISYDASHSGELHKAVIAALNQELKQAYAALGVDRHLLGEAVIAGNSTMRELFFALDVQSIGQRPYKSQVEHDYLDGRRENTAVVSPAHKLGLLMHPQALVYGAPLVASHVGADTTADLAAIGIENCGETILLVDVGTNTEVVLHHEGRLLAASCPAGPAFEGGLVKFGMTGCDGAIESMRLVDGHWEYGTIGGVPPEGICGSGLIDLLAELRRSGQMSPLGVFANRAKEITLVPERGITFSREDASNLAQAKAANYCGQTIVLQKMGISIDQIDRLYLAGGFANYINVRNAMEIGFLAPVHEERVVKLGNASVAGARLLLLSHQRRRAMENFVKRIEHVELETTPDFFDVFVDGCQFLPLKNRL